MRMHSILEPGGFAEPRDHHVKAANGKRRTALGCEHETATADFARA
jgi:hypothetical protein